MARHQVYYRARNKQSSVSTETVAYMMGGASLAMRELKHAVAHCPSGFFTPNLADQRPVKQSVVLLPTRPGWEAGAIAIRLTESGRHTPTWRADLIYQRRGNILSATYVSGGQRRSEVLADRLATRMAKQLNRVPPRHP